MHYYEVMVTLTVETQRDGREGEGEAEKLARNVAAEAQAKHPEIADWEVGEAWEKDEEED